VAGIELKYMLGFAETKLLVVPRRQERRARRAKSSLLCPHYGLRRVLF